MQASAHWHSTQALPAGHSESGCSSTAPSQAAAAATAAGGHRALADRAPVDAAEPPDHAHAHVGAARAAVAEPLVDGAVAVVVERVAHLLDRIDPALADERSLAADVATGDALAGVGPAGSADRDAVVDHAGAVGVEADADLRGRPGASVAHEHAADAAVRARGALAGVGRAGRAALGIALVDRSVAVVVEAVAAL